MAAAIAARLTAQLGGGGARAGPPPAAPVAVAVDGSGGPGAAVDINDAVARARAVAASLAAGGVLGKRKAEGEAGPGGAGFPWSRGEEQRKRSKLYVPTDRPDVNWMGMLIGPKVRPVPAWFCCGVLSRSLSLSAVSSPDADEAIHGHVLLSRAKRLTTLAPV